MILLRRKYVYRCAQVRVPLALLLISFCAVPALAENRVEFGRSTMAPRIEPQDLDHQEAMATILGDTLRSTSGWRRQGSTNKSVAKPVKTSTAKPLSASNKQVAGGRWQASGAKRGTDASKTTSSSQLQLEQPRLDWVPPRASGDGDVAEEDHVEAKPSKTDSAKPLVLGSPTEPTKVEERALSLLDESTAKPLPKVSSPKKAISTARRSTRPVHVQSPPKTKSLDVNSTATTPTDLKPLTRQQIALRSKVRSVLAHYYNRPFDTASRGPWELMHAMLSYEVHSRVLQNGPKGEPITAVGWLCFNQPCRKRTLMYLNQDGDLRVRVGPALQGHQGQLLALLAQARVKSNYPMKVEDKDLTIEDLIDVEKLTCYPRTELTFKLIGLMHYLPSDATWQNDKGYDWNFPRLIQEEMRQPVRGAACGGTHRLSGLTLAVKKRRQRGEPVNGEYAKADRFVRNYQNYAYRLQNSDGSFSTEWFRGPGAEEDVDRRLKTTGHILEWLLYAADEKQLNYWRTVKAVNYLANIMNSNRRRDWEAGPLGHAIHALVLYDRLVFSKYDGQPDESADTSVARGAGSNAR
ncbi:hypothetical protein [Adhaeretor mobilis]|uniref:hypothetical protein n=1 Tax=Adhaeretor mobilis TaxID=1930276 RepID=UPI0011A4E036|nr:hypothetical protein [Adhaeretor mobilis]